MGVKNALPAEERLLDLMLGEIKRVLPRATWTAAGIGVNQMRVIEWVLARGGDGLRTGLEDNIRVSRGPPRRQQRRTRRPRGRGGSASRAPARHRGRGARGARAPRGMITGRTRIVAHLGYPTESFKAPMIYNPWFEANGVPAVVVPMGVRAEDYAGLFRGLFQITNMHGALVTMPHKVTTTKLVDVLTPTAAIAGACNAVLRRDDGSLLGDMFDGTGFVRGMLRKGQRADGMGALVVGSGGVGSAIAASLAAAGVARLGLVDATPGIAEALAGRIAAHYPALSVSLGSNDPAGWDIAVNATPLGMRDGDKLPFDPARLGPGTFVGEVVMTEEFTPLLRAAQAIGCPVQVGTDMLFEMIPAYLEFFGFGTATPDELRGVSRVEY